MHVTKIHSYLKPTTRECSHLVTRGDFRSRDKVSGHTIRSAIFINPMLHCTQTSCFIELELLPIAGIGIFDLVCSCDVDLDPIIFIYELDPYIHTYIHTDRQTDRHDRNYIPRRFAGGQKYSYTVIILTNMLLLDVGQVSIKIK